MHQLSLTRPNQCSSFVIFFLLSRRTTQFNLLQTFSVSELYSIPIHQHTLLTLDHQKALFYCFCCGLLHNIAIKPSPLVIILYDSFIQNRIASALTTRKHKVKVRTDGRDDQLAHNWSSLLSLKDIQFLCLQDSCFAVNGHQDVSSPITARIPKSYVSNVIMPRVSVSEEAEKKNNSTEEERLNIRASSIPRPRAVLSSPDNDAVIGNNIRTKVARPTTSKNNKLMESRHEPCKVVPGQITDVSPTNTRKSKNTSVNNSELKVKKWSPTEESSQRRKIATDKPRFMRI